MLVGLWGGTAVRLDAKEEAMLAGALGEPRRIAIEQQLAVGRFFDAADFVAVHQAHLMADGEAVGGAGVELLERLAAAPEEHRRVLVPTVTDPRGVDPKACSWLRQPDYAPEREARIVRALEAMGILLTNTCINYQTVIPPVKGEHVAFGDTGSTIYANSVLGARSNFEGGCAALWAALTGRVPRYGFHLDDRRGGTRIFEIDCALDDLADWGAIGGVVGRRMASYWEVPVLVGPRDATSDQVKHLGAALASYGSTPMFHLLGVTPEAPDLDTACLGETRPTERIDRSDLEKFYAQLERSDPAVDLVVFAAPQLSLFELQLVSEIVADRTLRLPMLIAVPPEVARAGERMGLVDRLRQAGARILEGVCFYQMYAREIGELQGWRRLVTNSAKLANIIQGYGFEPILRRTESCVETAVRGQLA